jgi:cytochrome bd ubiquinol oxidase subunit II
VMTALALPLWLVAAGIVLRGAGFAFRKELSQLPGQRAAGATFAFSSLLTPFFMGTVVGAISVGAVPASASHAVLSAWTSPTALLAGFLFVAACGYLAAVYLVGEAERCGDRRMRAYFTRRAQAASIVAGALSLATLAELNTSNPALFSHLTGRALPLVVLAGVCGLTVFAMLTAGRLQGVRVVAALGIAAVVWGWGVALYPVLLPGTPLTLTNAGAPHATFVALIVVFIIAVVLIGPSFVLLFTLQSRRVLGAVEQAAPPAGRAAQPTTARLEPSPDGHPGPATRAAVLGVITLAAIVRRLRHR